MTDFFHIFCADCTNLSQSFHNRVMSFSLIKVSKILLDILWTFTITFYYLFLLLALHPYLVRVNGYF